MLFLFSFQTQSSLYVCAMDVCSTIVVLVAGACFSKWAILLSENCAL